MVSDSLKATRILGLYSDFLAGKVINKQEAARKYGVNSRSIQRDINCIRDFLSDQNINNGKVQSIKYDNRARGYRLISEDISNLSSGELLAICKILLESRAFSKEQVSSYLQTILKLCVSKHDVDEIQSRLSNELFYYHDPAHPAINTDALWTLTQAVHTNTVIDIDYYRSKDKHLVKRRVKPVGILFSEYYFYLLALIESPDIRRGFEKKDDKYPTIYRVDRIQKIHILDEHFSIPYVDKFKEGEYRNRVQFMYGGELQRIEFEYCGPSIEAILDRFPEADVKQTNEGKYRVNAEVFGNGIKMWLLSQGMMVKVLSPQKLVAEIKELLSSTIALYDSNL